MKLKTKNIIQISNALNTLGKAFPAQTKINIIRNIQVMRPFLENFETAQKALIAEVSPDGESETIDRNTKLLAIWAKKKGELLETVQDVKGLVFLNWSDLDAAAVDAVIVESLGVLVRGIPAPKDEDAIPE